ncbi:unnamed protein product [Rhizoctonia solani]|uniref:Chitin-binding type-2 domain-containing protein n=1 Tax=Rhizoctonia solani TaxID=456999 RepID=A0A8H3C7R7_9AGAM|nr:unnamed protein product [Rhizoctonia solani]
MLGLKVSAILAASTYLVVATPTATASNLRRPNVLPRDNTCLQGQWYWQRLGMCVPEYVNIPDAAPKPPTDAACPTKWYWNKNHCFPISKAALQNNCPKGSGWNEQSLRCNRTPNFKPKPKLHNLFPLKGGDLGRP